MGTRPTNTLVTAVRTAATVAMVTATVTTMVTAAATVITDGRAGLYESTHLEKRGESSNF